MAIKNGPLNAADKVQEPSMDATALLQEARDAIDLALALSRRNNGALERESRRIDGKRVLA